jgi:hypothetical protein
MMMMPVSDGMNMLGVLRSVHEYAVAKKERNVIEVWIRVSDRAGQWQLQALEVSDGEGRSYNVYGWPEVYASHEEAVILAKARAREAGCGGLEQRSAGTDPVKNLNGARSARALTLSVWSHLDITTAAAGTIRLSPR